MLKILHTSLLFLLSFAFCLPSFASAPNFQIAGIVHDANGAREPNAHVSIKGDAARPALEATTDDQGEFRVQTPGAGTFSVEIFAEGFKLLTVQAVLTPEAPRAQLDLELKVAANTESVVVTADALAAETTSTQLGETLGSQKLVSVPLNGRSFTDLMAVEPGIVPANTAQPSAVVMTGVASTPPSGNANPTWRRT